MSDEVSLGSAQKQDVRNHCVGSHKGYGHRVGELAWLDDVYERNPSYQAGTDTSANACAMLML